MFGSYFYHQRIRKAVAVFGSLFSDINVIRKNTSGSTISQLKVPLSYSPKRDFLDRIDKMINGEDAERQVAVRLPRMSFEITSMSYDNTRQLPKMNQCLTPSTVFDGKAKRLYTPVPYNIQFDLNIYAKSQDDALQIVEQILPFFTPNYNLTINPLEDFDLKEDTVIQLQNISFTDDYESLLEDRRTIIYTLSFQMKINLYRNINASAAIITQYDIDLLSLDGKTLFTTISDSANVPINNSATLLEGTFYTESDFKVRNVPRNIQSFSIDAQPSNGSATTALTQTLTTINGVVVAKGSWSYTPDSDYYGADNFTIRLNYGEDSAYFTVGVNVLVTSINDVVNDFISVTQNTPYDFYISTNDNWTTPVTYAVASGGEPNHGTITVLNSSTGYFRYTPNTGYVGSDTFAYRVTPTVGVSESGIVTITVS